jgi:hypothetical protein
MKPEAEKLLVGLGLAGEGGEARRRRPGESTRTVVVALRARLWTGSGGTERNVCYPPNYVRSTSES